MNSYRIFRFFSLTITYLLWPLQKLIQIASYLKFIRLIMFIIVFIIGLFTDSNTVKTNIVNLTSSLLLNVDYFLGFSLSKFQDIVNNFRHFIFNSDYLQLNDKASIEKGLGLNPIEVDTKNNLTEKLINDKDNDNQSVWSRHFRLVTTISICLIVLGAAYIAYNNSGATPPSGSIPNPTIIPEGGVLGNTTYYETFKNNIHNISNRTFDSIINWGSNSKEAVLEITDRIKTGNWTGIYEPTNSRVIEAKQAAMDSIIRNPNNNLSSDSLNTVVPQDPSTIASSSKVTLDSNISSETPNRGLNPLASPFIPSPDDYSVDKIYKTYKKVPIYGDYGIIGYNYMEQVHSYLKWNYVDGNGQIQTAINESVRGTFSSIRNQ